MRELFSCISKANNNVHLKMFQKRFRFLFRMDKHVRNMAERKKNAKTRRAVEISVEGRKMNL